MNQPFPPTSDRLIRTSLRKKLESDYKGHTDTKIFDELGVVHGAARVDVAVVNGIIHGYELKSDLDTLYRLPGQIKMYNSVLDEVTLVVGKDHLHEAFEMIPEWWGITVAKITAANEPVSFYPIRKAEQNQHQDLVAIARLLWREEALGILEAIDRADGVRSKAREAIYERLADSLDAVALKEKVRTVLRSRDWRVATP